MIHLVTLCFISLYAKFGTASAKLFMFIFQVIASISVKFDVEIQFLESS